MKKKYLILFFIHLRDIMSLLNPWMVPSLDEFTFLCCPECVFRSKTATTFQTHAVQNHPRSSVLFNAVKEEPPDFTDEGPISLDEQKGEFIYTL